MSCCTFAPVRRTTALVLTAAALLPAGAAVGFAGAAAPQPKLMALTREDVGHVAYVEGEGATTAGPIPALRGYKRTFTGLTPGSVQALSIEDTVLVGKTPAAAAKAVSSLVAASSTQAGLDRLYDQSAKAFAALADSPITKGGVIRARAMRAGDGAAEVVFRFTTADGAATQVGRLVVSVGGTLSVITWEGHMPGLSPATTRQFALAAATRMRAAAGSA